MKRLEEQRRAITLQGLEQSDWSLVVSRQGFWQKVSDEIRAEIDKYTRCCHHVIHSPVTKDTVLVKDDSSNELVRKIKLILSSLFNIGVSFEQIQNQESCFSGQEVEGPTRKNL